jgi:hypothetical protein
LIPLEYKRRKGGNRERETGVVVLWKVMREERQCWEIVWSGVLTEGNGKIVLCASGYNVVTLELGDSMMV